MLGVQGARPPASEPLRSIAAGDPRLDANDLDRLVDRAERQAGVLVRLRLQAAARTLGSRTHIL